MLNCHSQLIETFITYHGDSEASLHGIDIRLRGERPTFSVYCFPKKKKEQSGKVNIERVNDKSQIYGNVNRFNILQVFLLG
jgi:hypothetical protein